MTKEDLKALFVNGHLATGADFTNLIDSMKALQTAVSDPAANGTSVTFIATISQDAEGKITVTKKTVNFSGYQTTAGMNTYQPDDLQKTDALAVDDSGADIVTQVQHNMKHYPTVRVMDAGGKEVRPTAAVPEPYVVEHVDNMNVNITLAGALNTGGNTYTYILD